MGGRIDHTVSNLNTLLTHMHLRIVLLGDSSTARLLPAGSCSIRPAPVWVDWSSHDTGPIFSDAYTPSSTHIDLMGRQKP